MSNVGDIDDMARNAIHILENDQTLMQFKKQALEHARKFDIQRVLPIYEALYQKVISENQ